MIELAEHPSPIGPLTVAVVEGRVCALSFSDFRETQRAALERRFKGYEVRRTEDPSGVCGRLQAYFDGELTALDAIDVDPAGTPFQLAVWAALRTIAPGRTASYTDVAHAIGAPQAVRAVGAANGANPIAIIVPCHRVIGARGALVGYGGGLERKRWLLNHERAGTFLDLEPGVEAI